MMRQTRGFFGSGLSRLRDMDFCVSILPPRRSDDGQPAS